MIVVKPRNKREFKEIIAEARRSRKLVYISASPCPECEIFEAALEELKVSTEKIVKIEVPNEDWAVDFVLSELGVSGSPAVILPNGRIIDDEPIEMAKKVKQIVG